MEILRGNKCTLVLPVKDINGNLITDLATADDVEYMIKVNPQDADADALVYKNKSDGVSINVPVVGNITIILKSDETKDIPAGNYYEAVQINYSEDNQQEIILKENKKITNNLTIVQDTIRS